MADSESLPLQGPPQPAPPVRATIPPPIAAPPVVGHLPAGWPETTLGLPGMPTSPTPPLLADRPPVRSVVPDNGSMTSAPPEPFPPPIAQGPPANALPVPPAPDDVRPARAEATAPPQLTVPRARVPLAKPAGAPPKSDATAKHGTTAKPGAVVPSGQQPQAPETSLEDRAYRAAPSWLVSALVHMLILIILGLIFATPHMKLGRDALELDAIYSDRLGDQLVDDSILSGVSSPDHADKLMITPTDLPPDDDPFAAPKQPEISIDGTASAAALHAPTIGMALSGRQEGTRQSLLGAFGGTGPSEGAVDMGLAFLARQQQKDGSWSLKGPYSGGAYNENVEAATAMALLAFQARDNRHNQGQYQKQVKGGIEYLLKVQGPDGNFYTGNRQDWLYTHAQCTIVICELYGMTKDSHLRLPAEKAVKFCVEAQDALGGWRYRPRMDSDTSVTGWMVMALQSARMAGLEVPQETLKRVSEYLDRVTQDGSLYSYQVGQHPDPVMTAEALLCRQYLGWNQYDPKLVAGVEYLGSHLPNWFERDVYYWYYATQVMHHMGGDHWKRWNDAQRDMLVEHQEKTGPEKGSWDPKGKSPDAWAVRDQGGRLYVTCLSLYMLEVYYRHMPLYKPGAAGNGR